MKNKGILKLLGILLAIYVLLSWIIPVGYYDGTSFITDKINPIGIISIIKYPIIAFTSSVFTLIAICIMFIGGLYGVMKKTGMFSKIVDKTSSAFKNKEEIFLILTTFLLALLSSLTALTIPLFIFVPFVVGVLLKMGYNKITAMLSSVGAILVGNMATIYGFNVAGYIHFFYTTDINNGIIFRIILFTLLVGLLILFILLTSKNKKVSTEELKEIPYYEVIKNNKAKSLASIIVILVAIILVMIGMYNWFYGLNINVFNDFHNAISKIEYNKLPILSYIIGDINSIGYWTNYEFALIILITSFIVGKIGKLKFDEICVSFIDGIKKMLPVAVMTIMANIIFLFINSSSNDYTYYATICDRIFNTFKDLHIYGLNDILPAGITSAIGGLLYNDFPYMLNIVSAQVKDIYTNLTLITFVQYSVHGLVQLISPTSVLLVAGLSYLNISYKEYLKNIWKYFLCALGVIILLSLILGLF